MTKRKIEQNNRMTEQQTMTDKKIGRNGDRQTEQQIEGQTKGQAEWQKEKKNGRQND